MKIKFTLLSIEIQSDTKKKSPAQPKPTPSQSIKNTINIAQTK